MFYIPCAFFKISFLQPSPPPILLLPITKAYFAKDKQTEMPDRVKLSSEFLSHSVPRARWALGSNVSVLGDWAFQVIGLFLTLYQLDAI